EAVLTYSTWRRHFSSDPWIVGKSTTLDGASYQVVGVLSADFRAPSVEQPQLLTPLGLDPKTYGDDGDFDFDVIARLAPGATPEQALAELNVVQSRVAAAMSQKVELHATISPLKDTLVGSARSGLLLLFGAVAAVLLVVSVNLAGLLLGRASARARESAIRTALGATRVRLLTQMLTESALLSVVGGAAGLIIACWGLRLLVRLAPPDTPRLAEVHIDFPALIFAISVATLAGVLFGPLPAWRLAKANPIDALKSGGRTSGEAKPQARLRKLLIAAEVAVSVALVSTTGLLLSSLNRLLSVDKGFETQHVMTLNVTLPAAKYSRSADLDAFYTRTVENIERLPGVVSAGLVNLLPLQGEGWSDCVSLEGDNRPFPERPEADYRPVNGDYFKTLGIALISGRVFEQSDRGHLVAVISASVARSLWPGQNPVGKRFRRCDPDEPDFEIIGVAADMRAGGLEREPRFMVYVPYWYRLRPVASIAVRTASTDPLSAASAVRSAIWRIEKEAPISNVKSMEEIVAGSVAERRFQLGLLLTFAGSALLLAAIGIYGVVAESVVRRTNEIGIRVALGARSSEVVRLVLNEGLVPVAAGLMLGVGAMFVVARALRALLFEASSTDPSTLIGSVFVLSIVAVIACYLPARRAVRVDPMSALRSE
ncbi:MAG: ABC transporter permease, partial [Blastocatellia bacterium]